MFNNTVDAKRRQQLIKEARAAREYWGKSYHFEEDEDAIEIGPWVLVGIAVICFGVMFWAII